MIDIENILFTKVATALRAEFSTIFVSGDVTAESAPYPRVFFYELSNQIAERHMSSRDINDEQFVDLLYEAQIYSNKTSGKKAETKAIAAIINEVMQEHGFRRIFNQPLENLNNATIARRVLRWVGVASDEGIIYRR
ncbi:MAG: hypothetical protein WC965_13390 [Thiohalomonadaceae bacterium]